MPTRSRSWPSRAARRHILRLAERLGLLPAGRGAQLADAFVALCALERRQTLQGAGTVVDRSAADAPARAILDSWNALFGTAGGT